MSKQKIIFAITVIVLIITIVLIVPRSTKITHTLNAVILDSNGNDIGTVQIYIQGRKVDYLYSESRLDVNIPPFHELTSIQASVTDGVEGLITESSYTEYLTVNFSAWDLSKNDMVFCRLCFSPDMDRWIFCNLSSKTYYIASVSGQDEIAELKTYFQNEFH